MPELGMAWTDSAHNNSLNLDYGTLCSISRFQIYDVSAKWANLEEELFAELSHPHTGASAALFNWTMDNGQ